MADNPHIHAELSRELSLFHITEKRSDMLIMGYGHKMKSRGFWLGSNLDPVVERSACDIVIFKEPKNRLYKRILVPVAGGPNSVFALEVASILVEKESGSIVLFSVDSGRNRFDVARFLREHYHTLQISKESISTKTVLSHDVADAIIDESEAYDLVVIGITNQSRMYRAVKSTIPETIAKSCSVPLVLVRAQSGVGSLIRRLI